MTHHLSYSSLAQADDCLGWYNAQRNAETRPVEAPSAPREIGSLVHKMIEIFLTECGRGEAGEDAAYAALVTAGNTAHYEEAKRVFDIWRSRFSIATAALVGVEEFLERTLEGVPPIVGYPDVVYLDGRTIVAHDFKTGWATDVTANYAFQGDLMCWLLKGQYPTRDVASEVDFVRTGKIERREFDGYRAALTEQRVRAIWARIEAAEASGLWARTPGKHCGYCPIAVSCAESRDLTFRGASVTSAAEAQDALVRLARLDAATKTLKASLRDYTGQNGAVEAAGVRASFEASETIGCTDVPALVERVGIDAAGLFLTVDSRKAQVKKLKADPAFAEFFGVTGRRNEFKISGSLDVELEDGATQEDVA